jgi:succinoglycan biosynthesis protein ExoA
VASAAAGVYAIVTGAEALRVARPLGPLGAATVWAIFPVLHLAHGVGFASGLWRYVRRPDWSEVERLDEYAAPDASAPAMAARAEADGG